MAALVARMLARQALDETHTFRVASIYDKTTERFAVTLRTLCGTATIDSKFNAMYADAFRDGEIREGDEIEILEHVVASGKTLIVMRIRLRTKRQKTTDQASATQRRAADVPRSQPSVAVPGATAKRVPICGITPLMQRFAIQGTVLDKSNVRTFSSGAGGKVFNLTLGDDTGVMQVSAFNDACDMHHAAFEVGHTYTLELTGKDVRKANRKFNTTGHDFEVSLRSSSTVTWCSHIAAANIDIAWTRVAAIPAAREGAKVNVQCVVLAVYPVSTFVARSGRDCAKQVLVLADASSMHSIAFTSFTNTGEELVVSIGDNVRVMEAMTSTWAGVSISNFGADRVKIVGDGQPAAALVASDYQPLSDLGMLSIAEPVNVYTDDINEDTKALTLHGRVADGSFVPMAGRKDVALWYIACPQSKKKLIGADETTLEAFSEHAGGVVTGVRRWIVRAECSDAGGTREVQFFNDTGKVLMGMTADEFASQKRADETSAEAVFRLVPDIFATAWKITCKTKVDNYMEQERLILECTHLAKIDPVTRGHELLAEILAKG